MSVSKRLRYEVLRRDNYTCRYCGAKSPDVEITVDHVVPKALGGSDEPSNLVAACRPCNDGKTSSSPDAPLVAEVAEDALRWSQAMTAAAGEMLARASGDEDTRTHFENVWNRYGAGPNREPLPKEPGWQATVDNLLRAGLPMTVLEECVGIAMSQRRVSAENVFRYMCGVAWRKVHELRERASELVKDPTADDDDDLEDAATEAIDNWCRINLKQRDPRDVEKAAKDCLGRAGDEAPSGVLWFVIHNLETDRAELCGVLRSLLEALPDDLGVKQISEQEEYWRDRPNPRGEPAVLSWAACNATWELEVARAQQELAAMPAGVREGWIQRARDDWAEIAGHVDEFFYVKEAAELARKSAAPQLAEAEH